MQNMLYTYVVVLNTQMLSKLLDHINASSTIVDENLIDDIISSHTWLSATWTSALELEFQHLNFSNLNFYTTYSYNKWYNTLQPCPLCNQIPDSIFHILFDCKFTKALWKRLHRVLLLIIPIKLTNKEKALGLQSKTKQQDNAILLRNWITFFLRHFIMLEERRAYHIPHYYSQSLEKIFIKFNFKALEDLKNKKLLYDHRNASDKFENIVTINKAIASLEDGEYIWKDIM